MLLTDHSSLTSFFKQPSLNTRQARWMTFLSEFDFDIKHLKGRENCVVDALSRKLHCVCDIFYSQVQTIFFD